jgi:hypothetical protein
MVWKFDLNKLLIEQFFNLQQQNILIKTIVCSSIIYIWCAHKLNIRDFFFQNFNTFNFFQFFKILIAWTGLISSLFRLWTQATSLRCFSNSTSHSVRTLWSIWLNFCMTVRFFIMHLIRIQFTAKSTKMGVTFACKFLIIFLLGHAQFSEHTPECDFNT